VEPGNTAGTDALTPDGAFLAWTETAPGGASFAAYWTNLGGASRHLMAAEVTPWSFDVQQFVVQKQDDGGPPHLATAQRDGTVFPSWDLPDQSRVLSVIGNVVLFCKVEAVDTEGHTHCTDLQSVFPGAGLENHETYRLPIGPGQTIRAAVPSPNDSSKAYAVVANGYVSGEHEGEGDVWRVDPYAAPRHYATPAFDEQELAFSLRPTPPVHRTAAPSPAARNPLELRSAPPSGTRSPSAPTGGPATSAPTTSSSPSPPPTTPNEAVAPLTSSSGGGHSLGLWLLVVMSAASSAAASFVLTSRRVRGRA
jgi:hypothetical protein